MRQPGQVHEMDEKTRELLDKHGTLILPEVIDHDSYTLLLEALLHVANKSLVLHCRGDGGGSRAARAMVDLIRQHGNVTGLLAGEANSSHAVIWSACQQRYVYPYGAMGVHMVAFDSITTRVDSQVLSQIAADYARMDMENAHIFAEASNHSPEWWYEVIQKAGSGGLTMFTAQQLLLMDMARPIAAYRPADSKVIVAMRFTGEKPDRDAPFGLT